MATQKKISDYVLKPAFEVASSAIIIIDSSDEIDEEENVIEDSEILRDISDSQPAGSHENEHTDNESEHATDQSNYSSDEECVDSNVDEDVNTQVNVSLCPNSDCSCMCKGCTDLSISHQLKDVDKSKLIHSHNSKERQDGRKSYCRKIQTSWYKKYPWITVCSSRYTIFCRTCRSAQQQGLLSSSVLSSKSPFITGGFGNWRKALKRFQEHEKSEMHLEAMERLAAKASSSHIGVQLNTHYAAEQKFHKIMLLKLLEVVRFLGRQGLPLRGHCEDVKSFEGNLYQLLLLQSKDFPRMRQWLHQKEYISPVIINEIVTLMGQTILKEIIANIRDTLWYSLIADEATDVSRTEQLSITIRWVDKTYQVHEDTLGLKELRDTKAETIHHEIKDILIRCALPVYQCRAQAYDGASNMSGVRNGVQAIFKREEPRALYVHCLAHSLNLCVQDISKVCTLIRNTVDFIRDLIQLIKFSPKRLTMFDSLRKDMALNSGESSPSLRTLCPTRWTVRHSSITSILKNYRILMDTLEQIQVGHDEYAAKASGLLNKMEQFNTYFGLKLANQIFAPTEQFSTNLQAVDVTVQEALRGAALLVSYLKSLRTETMYNRFYDHTVEESGSLTEEPKLPRIRKAPRRIDHGSSPHTYACAKDIYRHAYYEALDLVSEEVERRFQQSDINTIKEIEVVLLSASNGDVTDSLPDTVVDFLKNDLEVDRLKVQLHMLPDLINTALAGSIKKVTNVRTIVDALVKSDIYQNMLCEVNKVILLYFTFPVTTATAERSFSDLCRMKTFLRSTMSPCRLNNLFLLYVHKQKTDKLDLNLIAKEFVSVNKRRINYFGKP